MNNSTWYQQQISTSLLSTLCPLFIIRGVVTSGTWTITLPTNLASGNYIIRHEIIALQGAVSLGGAEFYPSCTQITVGGSQSGAPQQSELVKFPGAYQDSDPGIYDPDVCLVPVSFRFVKLNLFRSTTQTIRIIRQRCLAHLLRVLSLGIHPPRSLGLGLDLGLLRRLRIRVVAVAHQHRLLHLQEVHPPFKRVG